VQAAAAPAHDRSARPARSGYRSRRASRRRVQSRWRWRRSRCSRACGNYGARQVRRRVRLPFVHLRRHGHVPLQVVRAARNAARPLWAKSGLMHCSKRRKWVSLFEHPISTGEQRRWHFEAERRAPSQS